MSDIANKPEAESNDEMAAARQAANEAKEMAVDAYEKVKRLEPAQLGYLGAMAVVVLATILFDMAAFRVFTDGAVSETQAAAERSLQANMNAWSYSAFTSSLTGKLMWLCALGGLGIVLWSTIAKVRSAWIPLAQAGCAIGAAFFMLLLYVVGFPDLSGVDTMLTSKIRSSATLFGYWLPLAAATTAAYLSIQRIMSPSNAKA